MRIAITGLPTAGFLALGMLCGVTGCHRSASPAAVEKDIAAARQEAARDTQNAEVTEAEGARKVALAECEGLAGTAQQDCRDKAEADYKAARERARQMRAAGGTTGDSRQ